MTSVLKLTKLQPCFNSKPISTRPFTDVYNVDHLKGNNAMRIVQTKQGSHQAIWTSTLCNVASIFDILNFEKRQHITTSISQLH